MTSYVYVMGILGKKGIYVLKGNQKWDLAVVSYRAEKLSL
jgi:hypothetical protein